MTPQNGNLAGRKRSEGAHWRLRRKAEAATRWLIDVVQAVLLAWVLAAIFNLVKEKEDDDA
jgi:hypothetical protein